WQKALRVPRVGVTDSFFDLGGHSLLAVKIVNDIERSFGLRLPLATLFECPTVELFARRLSEIRSRPAELQTAAFTTVVPIQPHGTLPAFFCVAGVGGNPMNLRHLAQALGDDQPFYGLQFRGVDGQLSPHRRVQDMADEFLADMRRVQAQGPYYIGGYSAGGLCAYEMAQILRERGEQVGLVVFFDTLSPLLPEWTFIERVDAHLQNYRQRGLRYVQDRLLAHVRDDWERFSRSLRARLAEASPFKYRHDAVWIASEQAIGDYRPEAYQGDVLLLRADARLSAEGGIGYRPHESNGWRDLVRGELSVVELACSHRDIVSEHAAALAAKALKRALATARARYRRPRTAGAAPGNASANVAELHPRGARKVRLTG
ncbi:MAG TPA: thioesterase domain-containing protein, partial [Polyangiaceae bacterium]|nr:thioesterase domain-containing protein [Polyangiaceae bacterium]